MSERSELRNTNIFKDKSFTSKMVNDLLSIIDSCPIGKILQPYFSERALMSSRLFVEVEYLLALSETEGVGCRKFTEEERTLLHALPAITAEDSEIIKAIEIKGYSAAIRNKTVSFPKTDHDVKAIEYFMQLRLTGTSLEDCFNWIHFGLTSEDINHLATSRNMKRFLDEVYITTLNDKIEKTVAPTSVSNAQMQIVQLQDKIKRFKFTGKLMGATGTLAAHRFALPEIDWLAFSKKFVENLGFEANLYVTQIEQKDNYAKLFQSIALINELLPHVDQEANTYLRRANSLFQVFADKLPVSRLQRDLSDSTVQRNFGVAFGYSLLAIKILSGEKYSAVESKPQPFDAISPLAGRYYKDVKELEQFPDMNSAIATVYIPAVAAIISYLDAKANEYALLPMLARTHGQAATPTTVGKEYRVFAERLSRETKELEKIIAIDSILKNAEVAHTIARINTIIKDLAIDFWLYIKDEWIVQKNTGAVGSSTMPHKINPIYFENAEGNVYIANALLHRVASYDATNLRESVGYSLLVAKNVLKGLDKTTINEIKIVAALYNHPEVLAEAYQTELRKPEYGIADPYKLLKDFTQTKKKGKPLTLELLHEFVDNLPINTAGKEKLRLLTPETYLGYATTIAKKDLTQ
ncbi:hypothetical protein HZA96_05720 [Candidatus Woesearchaeota archaeon]|nr:hypothetical protein [Candidatus Woesearchaeota archaeon]